jgi:hypothetical protein
MNTIRVFSIFEMVLMGKIKGGKGKRILVPLIPSQIPLALASNRKLVSASRDSGITASAV